MQKREPQAGDITDCWRCSGEGSGEYLDGRKWTCTHCEGDGQIYWFARGHSWPISRSRQNHQLDSMLPDTPKGA